MKCAKCGRDVGPNELRCPWCDGRGQGQEENSRTQFGCPCCGSPNVVAVRKNYDPGCGCLGLLLFSWIGLLLGFLGSGEVEMVCGQCGAKWPAGKPHKAKRSSTGCLAILIIILIILVLLSR